MSNCCSAKDTNQIQPNMEESDPNSKIKSLMGRTPGVLKSKFLSVLGNSSEIITELSNKIDAALSLSSSETETTANRNEEKVRNLLRNQHRNSREFDSELIDFEARRIKERRAHEELISGRYRQPAFISRRTPDDFDLLDMNQESSNSKSTSNYSNSIDSRSLNSNNDEEINDLCLKQTQNEPKIVVTPEIICKDKDQLTVDMPRSASTSEHEANISVESSDLKMWIRSESDNSVPSWATSISLDSQTEEVILEFMRRFVNILFKDSASIPLELKSEFGHYARTESGRLWFSRLINAQRVKSKRVDETTFYSLIQYFAIVLFECAESDDFGPAKSLMNMCFTFYHDIDVPGCEPYREYIYIYLKEQPIWHSLRFWNAAFFDALNCERNNRPVPPTHIKKFTSLPSSENDYTASSCSSNERSPNLLEITEDKQYQQNISFGQLGSFTCNMHAFGLTRDLCNEFLRKQCIIANLNKDQVKMLQDNVNRMYRETDPWRK